MFLYTLLFLWVFKAKGEKVNCQMIGSPEYPVLYKDGNVIIGGAFSIHTKITLQTPSFTEKPQRLTCTSLNFREFQFVQTMLFAIDEINKSSLLPNISIGYKIFDSCGSTLASMRSAMGLINGQHHTAQEICYGHSAVQAIIGESESSSTIVMSSSTGPFMIPVISHFATCACLSNRKQYPTFFRTIPSDYYQSRALAQLVKYFGWTWVGTVRSDNDYGNNGMATFMEAVAKEGVCVEYSVAILRTNSKESIAKVVEVIKKGTAKVLVAFLAQSEMEVLLEEALVQNITGLQWVGSESWITARYLATKRTSNILSSAIGFTINKSKIPGLKDFLLKVHPSQSPTNALLTEFWETTFGCQFFPEAENVKLCTGYENLKEINNTFTDVSELRISNNVYKAVYAIAYALHNTLACQTDGYLDNVLCSQKDILLPGEILHSLQTVNFTMPSGEQVYFNSDGDPTARYELVNWQRNEAGEVTFVTVGNYDASHPSDEQFVMKPVNIVWAGNSNMSLYQRPRSMCSESCQPGYRQAQIKGRPPCCFECVQCPVGEITNMTDSIECIRCPLEYWSNENHSLCVPKKVEFLSFDEDMGVILTVFSLTGVSFTVAVGMVFFYFIDTPLVKASNTELSFLLLFSLTLCFLCSLTFIGQPSKWSCMLRHTAFGITFALCMSCVLARTIAVVMAFKATVPANSPPQCSVPVQRMSVFCCTLFQIIICALWLGLAPPVPHKNMVHSTDKIILECDLGSAIGFWAVLGYIGVLAALCFILAFLARKLPDNFNEAKFITFSMLIFCAVWITFIPAYVSSPGKVTVAVEIFAILASSFGLLFCIFSPKCYIIMLKPEHNTRKHVMGKAHARSQ
ncbi:extracellular calcium-sensing receptor-like [Electrophorus electricus]|uniref:extracellular calcium-sensing receptor-like n=1 Tax=Electrophorus electricus TaxID=8005 RepID=UPI0015CFC023|nr:extracellular calcium-sensing receptor-like [Electrophorus electricus]